MSQRLLNFQPAETSFVQILISFGYTLKGGGSIFVVILLFLLVTAFEIQGSIKQIHKLPFFTQTKSLIHRGLQAS